MTDAAPAPASRLSRDRLTRLIYVELAAYGYFVYAFGPSVSLLREEQGISRAVAGLHGTALAAGSVVAGLVGAAGTRRWGRGAMLRIGLAGLAVGAVLIAGAAVLPLTLLGALIAGTFGSLVVNAHSPVLSDHHELAGSAAIAEANALAAGLGVAAPLVVGAAAALSAAWWRAGLLVVVPLVALALLYSRGVAIPAPAPDVAAGPAGETAAGPAGGVRRGARRRLPRRYWGAWAVLVLCVAVEFSMTIWAPDLLRGRVGASDGASAAAVTAIVLGMSAGRFVGGRLALRFPIDGLLLATIAVTAAGFAVFWLSTVLALSLLGLLLVGIGIALQFPLGIARAIDASDGQSDIATARASLGAGAAIGLAPFVLGSLADTVGTHLAYLLVPCLLAVAGAILLLDRRRRPAAVLAG